MKPKVTDEIDDRTRHEIQLAYRLFYNRCICNHSCRDDQWDDLIDLARRMSQHGLCQSNFESIRDLDEVAKITASGLYEAISKKDLQDAVLWAIRFGHLFRYGYSIVDDRAIQVGNSVVSGGKKGAVRAHGDADKLRERNAKMQAFLIKKMNEDPKLPFEKAKRMAASEFKVSPATVKSVTTNPRTRGVRK